MFNKLILYFKHLKNSKKIIFVSTIGLICAIAIVSSSLLYIDTTKQDIVSQLFNSTENSSGYDITIDYSVNSPKINVTAFTQTINEYSFDITQKLNLNIFSNPELFSTVDGAYVSELSSPTDISKPMSNNSVLIVQLNTPLRNDLASFLSENASLPANNSQIQQAFALQTAFVKFSFFGI